jgi:hypothetical protein
LILAAWSKPGIPENSLGVKALSDISMNCAMLVSKDQFFTARASEIIPPVLYILVNSSKI